MVLEKKMLLACKWALSHISAIYTGSDSKVRVINITTKSEELKRSFLVIDVLPIDYKNKIFINLF